MRLFLNLLLLVLMAIPTFRQGVCGSMEQFQNSTTWKARFPNDTLAHNNLFLFIDANSGVTITAGNVTDNAGNSWIQVLAPVVAGQSGHCYRVADSAAGTREVTVVIDVSDTFMQFTLVEVAYCSTAALATALDGTAGSATGQNTTTITSGATTTTVNGDLIFQYIFDRAQLDQASMTAGTGFTLLSAQGIDGIGLQMQVQAALGTITPSMTIASASNYNTFSFAIKPDSTKGDHTLTGVRVDSIQHHCPRTWTSKALPFPARGNCIHVSAGWGDTAVSISGVTDNKNNTYVRPSANSHQVDSTQRCDAWTAFPATTGQDLVVTVTLTGGTLGHGMVLLYDVTGAGGIGSGSNGTQGSQGAPGGDLVSLTITRSSPSSLVIYGGVIFQHTAINLGNGTGKWYPDMMTEANSDGADRSLDECDLWGHSYGTDLTAETATWQIRDLGANTGVLGWCLAGTEIIAIPVWASLGSPYHPGRSPGLGGISSARFQTNWWPYSPPVVVTFDPALMTAMEKHGNDPIVLSPQVVASGMTPPEQMPT